VLGERTIEVDPSEQIPGQLGSGDIKPKIHHVFGDNALKHQSTHEMFRPVKRGVITDMDHMETILSYIFEKEFDLSTKDMNVLMTDNPMNSKENK
jgi:actin-related protein